MSLDKYTDKIDKLSGTLIEDVQNRPPLPNNNHQEDMDFMADSKAALLEHKTPLANIVLYVVIAFFISAFVWAYYAVVEEVTVGNGKIIPSSKVKHIQNLEGGILGKLFIKEGQIVKKGQVMIQLDNTRFHSEYQEQKSLSLSLQATIARLQAEVAHAADIVFPQIIADKHPGIVASENALFSSRHKMIASKLLTLKSSRKLMQREIDITEPLVKEGVLSEVELLQLKKKINEIDGAIKDETLRFTQEAQSELTKAQSQLGSLKEKLRSLQDRMLRTTIRSPVRGIVKQININTLGGIVKPGEDIVEVVPLDDTLLVEANITPQDIAFIHPNQKATVKITAYDYGIYGGLNGVVTHISADSHTDEKGNSFYEVWVRTDKNYLGTETKQLPIIPGMMASVHILTGHKTILDYILKPILKAKYNALRER